MDPHADNSDQTGKAGSRSRLGWRPLLIILIPVGFFFLVVLAPHPVSRIPYSMKTKLRVESLARGVSLYRSDTGGYPGQRQMGLLVGEGGWYSGSEMLAMAMYGVEDTKQGPEGRMRSCFDLYKPEFITGNYFSQPYTLSDGFPGRRAMAICYYVPRPGQDGVDRFVEADNAVYTGQARGGDFREFVKQRAGPYGPLPGFLLIAPGADRKYFTADDITNF